MGGDEPYAYYGTPRSASPYWHNEVTRGSLHTLMTFDALGAAELLAGTPLLIVHAPCPAKPGARAPAWVDDDVRPPETARGSQDVPGFHMC